MPSTQTEHLFTDKAEAYAKYRPTYPTEVIDFIFHHFSNTPTHLTAVDVGAGTGIASRILAERGVDVIAVEPNQAMIDSAEEHPNVRFINTSAENINLDSNSVDLMTVFQAFHWFDFKKSLQEFRRILAPSGQLALIWSYWDLSDPFTARYANLIKEAAKKNKERVSPYDGFPGGMIKKGRMNMLWKLKYLPYFQKVKRGRFKYVRNAELEVLIGDARSQSYLIHEGKPWQDLLDKIEALYQENDNPQIVYSIHVFTALPK